MRAIIARIRAWWAAGLQPGNDPTPEQALVMRDIERMWQGKL